MDAGKRVPIGGEGRYGRRGHISCSVVWVPSMDWSLSLLCCVVLGRAGVLYGIIGGRAGRLAGREKCKWGAGEWWAKDDLRPIYPNIIRTIVALRRD